MLTNGVRRATGTKSGVPAVQIVPPTARDLPPSGPGSGPALRALAEKVTSCRSLIAGAGNSKLLPRTRPMLAKALALKADRGRAPNDVGDEQPVAHHDCRGWHQCGLSFTAEYKCYTSSENLRCPATGCTLLRGTRSTDRTQVKEPCAAVISPATRAPYPSAVHPGGGGRALQLRGEVYAEAVLLLEARARVRRKATC